MSENWSKGEFVSLARLAREKRIYGEYEEELRFVLLHCRMAYERIESDRLMNLDARADMWTHIASAISLAEQELKRIGVNYE